MDGKDNLIKNTESVNINFETDIKMQKLKEELQKSFAQYQKTMKYMLADAPLQVLCLPTIIETILLDSGILRIYDLFDVDLTEIKGLGVVRLRQLTTSLDKFISML